MKFVWRAGMWVPRSQVAQASAGVAIVRDFDAPLLCHADGKLHGSRSTYDAAVRSAGMVEVGKTEMRRLQDGPAVRATPMPSVRDSLRRFANE